MIWEVCHFEPKKKTQSQYQIHFFYFCYIGIAIIFCELLSKSEL